MTTPRRVTKNTFFLFLGDGISRVLGLALIIFIARYLGDIGYGKYAFAFAFASLFLVLSDLGISALTIREVARDTSKAGKYIGSSVIIKAILSLGCLILIAIVINLMDYPQDTTLAVYIVGLALVFSSFNDFSRSIFRAFEKMEYEMVTKIAVSILALGLGLMVLLLGYGLVELVLMLLVARAFIFLASSAIVIRTFARPEFKLDPQFSKGLIKSAIPIGLSAVFVAIYFQIDSVMLSVMKGDAPVGWYNASYQLIMGFLFIPHAFTHVMFPLLSRYFRSSIDSLKFAYEKSFKYLLMLALPFSIGTTLVAHRIIFLLYGEGFANSVIVLQILAWAGSLIFLANLTGAVMISIDRQKTNMFIVGSGAVANIILNLILIPRYSFIGAASATVVTNLLVLSLGYRYVKRYLRGLPLSKICVKPLAAASIMGIIVYLLNANNFNLFVIIIGAAFLYGGILYLIKAFDADDLSLMKRAFRREV